MNRVLALGKYMSCYGTVMFERWTDSCYKTDIYLDFVSYVFSVRPSETLSWEVHAGGLTGHFGWNKTNEVVEYRFYWPSLKKDAAKVIG